MKSLIKLTVCFAAVSSSLGLDFNTDCPDLSPVQDFNLTNYLGTWYQYAGFNNIIEGPGNCSKAQYSLDSETGSVNVVNSMMAFGIPMEVTGTASLANPASTEGRLTVNLNTIVGKGSAELLVMDTDYVSYAVVWSCQKVLIFPYETAYVLTRDQQPDDSTVSLVQEAMTRVESKGGTSADKYKLTNQQNCVSFFNKIF